MKNGYVEFYPSMTAEQLREILSLSIFIADKSRPNLDSIWFDQSCRRWVATDGNRLASYQLNYDDDLDTLETCYFPKELAKEMLKVKFESVRFMIPDLGQDETETHVAVIELIPKNGIGISFKIPDSRVENKSFPDLSTMSFDSSDYGQVEEPSGFDMNYLADFAKYVKKCGTTKSPMIIYHGHQIPKKGKANACQPTLWSTTVDGFALILMPMRIN